MKKNVTFSRRETRHARVEAIGQAGQGLAAEASRMRGSPARAMAMAMACMMQDTGGIGADISLILVSSEQLALRRGWNAVRPAYQEERGRKRDRNAMPIAPAPLSI